MNKKRNRILALFCSLMIMATYFISPIYQTVLAEEVDSHFKVVDGNYPQVSTETAYAFKVWSRVGTSLSDTGLTVEFKDKSGNTYSKKLTGMLHTQDEGETRYIITDFFPESITVKTHSGNRHFHWDIYALDTTGEETHLVHWDAYKVGKATQTTVIPEEVKPTISDGYVNVYTPDLNGQAVVEGKGNDSGTLTVGGTIGTNMSAEAYGIDQYGFRYQISNPKFQVIKEGSSKGTNFSTDYMFSSNTQYNGEKYYVSTPASIGTESAIEIKSKTFAVNNESKNVTFSGNGGQFSNGSSTQTVNQKYAHGYALPNENPTRAGYTFTGWKENGSSKDVNSKLIYNGETTVNAQWSENTYTITLHGVKKGLTSSSGWTNSNGEYTQTFKPTTGGTISLPEANTADSHAFDGWYEVGADGIPQGEKIESIDLTNSANWRNINLIAVYDEAVLPSVLILDKGEAPNDPGSLSYVTGSGTSPIHIDIDDCKAFENLYEGHDFSGLSYAPNAGGPGRVTVEELQTGTSIQPQLTETEYQGKKGYKATATALYTAKTYTITKENEGSDPSQTEQQVTFGQSYDLGEPTRTNYEFKGWNTAADGTGLTIPTQGTVDTSFDGLKVYAQWELKNINVTYVYGYDGENTTELSLSPDQPYAFPEEANIEGTTTRWFNESGEEVSTYDNVPSGITSMTLTAKYSFPITLDYGYYGLVDNEFMVTYGDTYNLPDLSNNRVNYTFHGWYYDRFYVVYSDDIVDIKPEDNVELLGRWTKSVQLQMNESVTTIVDSFGEVEVDENDIPMYRMSSVAIDKEEIYQAVKLLLVLKHKYPNVDTSEFIDEGRGWLETLRTKIAERHHESEGLEVKGLEWFIQMTADVKSENDDLWKEMSSRIDRNEILKLYDVELLDIIEEVNYEPSTGAVTLRVPIPENIDDYEDTVLFHYNRVKNEMEYLDYEVKDGFYEVQLSSFSPVGIAANTKFGKVTATGDKIPSLLVAGALLAGLGISIVLKKKQDENDLSM